VIPPSFKRFEWVDLRDFERKKREKRKGLGLEATGLEELKWGEREEGAQDKNPRRASRNRLNRGSGPIQLPPVRDA
jgi:hypothetical protein